MSFAALRLPCLEIPRLKFGFLAAFCITLVALFGLASRADAQCSGSGSGPYTCTGGAAAVNSGGGTAQVANSTTAVSATGSVQSVYVVLNGVTSDGCASSNLHVHDSLAYASFLLKSPSGQKFQFLGASGNGGDGANQCGLSGVQFTIQDGGPPAPDNGNTGFPATPTNQTYGPSSYFSDLDGTSPPQGSVSQWPQKDGGATPATFATSFLGATANGTWTLSLMDSNPATLADPVSISGWSLVVTLQPSSNANTTTTLSSNTTPSFTSGANSSVTLTATVTSAGTVNLGTVKFTDGGTIIASCGAQPFNGSGQAACTTTFSTEGVHSLGAAYSGGAGFNTSSGTLNQLVENHTTSPGTDQYCNTSALSNNGVTTAPYPSIITVPSLGGTVANVSVTLNGFTASGGVPLNYGFLLVAPDGTHNLDFLDDAGVSGTAQSAVNLTIADGGAVPPVNGGLTSNTYEPTNYELNAPSFPASFSPAPALPGTINYAQPDNVANNPLTLTQAFNQANPAGAWSLFMLNNGGSSTPLSVTGGWCVSFEVNNGAPTTTTLTSSENPAFRGDAAPVTATVKNGGSAVTQGTVTIVDTTTGTTLVSNAALSGSGTVNVNVGSLTEGDHNLTATYSGVNNTFDPSSGTLWQRTDNRSTVSGGGTAASPAVYCNAGGFVLPGAANNIGAANPNPTNLFVTNLPGTLKSVTVELNGFHTGSDSLIDTASLLVGPNGKGLDFFSGTGASNTILAAGNYDFADSASNNVPQTSFAAGTYQPTSYNGVDTFFHNASSQYTLPTTINYSDPHSNPFTLNGVSDGDFTNIDGNGVWSLYFNQNIHDTGSGATGWCLSLVENAVTGTGTTSHTGPNPSNHMAQGGTGTVSFSLLNNGDASSHGSTGDPDGIVAHAMTVTGTLPAGLTLGTVPTGTPWNCTAVTSTAVTCTNTNSVAEGSSYSALTIPVNVASNAGATATVSGFTFSGAGMTAGTFSADTITIDSSATLAVSKTAVGTFTQGQQGQWDIVVSNTASASGATSGTTTVSDTMPSGYTIQSVVAGANWSCSSSTTTVAVCTSTAVVAGQASFQTITLNVAVPAASATSITNTATAWGGGDLIHTNQGTGATGFSTVTVVQVPATINLTSGNNQSTSISTAFPTNLSVTVLDAGSQAISGASVTFTAPAVGASGTFASTSTRTTTANTNASGVAAASVFTANGTAGGPYNISVTAGSITSSFSETNTASAATSMTANAGTTPQSTAINTAFANPLAVTVKDVSNNPVSGVTVTFTAPGSGASGKFSNSTATISVVTNASGIASAPFTANSTSGGPYTVAAAAASLTSVSFSLTNNVGAANSMTTNAGTTPQSATISTAFTNALAVTVKDASNNPVSGVNVTFSAPGSGASGAFSNSTTTITVATNASGIASAPFTANGTAGGPYSATAASAGLTTVSFSLTNSAGAASVMTANAGTTPQTTAVSTAFANALAVTVKDASNNPVSGVNVTFSAPGSGASGAFSNSTTTITVGTNASGVASAPFTANGTAGGPYLATAASAGLTTVNFSLTNNAGAASSMTANAGTTPQSVAVNTAFGNPLAVTVKDASNNPISGVNVTFSAPGSGASGAFSNSTTTITVATNASGIASAPFTANGTSGGPYTVTAAAASLTTVNFSLTNSAGAASVMTANAGTTPQSTAVSTAFTNPLAVTVKDASNNPVSGVNVTFSAPGSGASGAFSNSTTTITVATNASGVASAPFTANGTAGGPYSATAASAGLTTVNFSLTNTAGAASSMTANAGTTPQSALVNAMFANALAVTMKDASNNPVSGLNVTFTGPASGASGAFSNSINTITVATNASGIATAPFTANNTPGGPYTVSAAAAGLTAVNFSLTNTPAALTVTCSPTNSGTVNVAFNSGGEMVSGGVQPYTFYVGSGLVPNGLMLNTTNGAVSGTPLTSGAFSISVKDTANTVAATSCPFTMTAPALVITWPAPAAITYGTGLSAVQLDASANASGSFTYNPAATTILTAGSHQLSATFMPTDTKDYAVTTVHVTQVVNKATPVLSWSPAPLQIGSKLTAAQLDATANVPGKFVYTPSLGTEITSSTETLKVVFTPTDNTDYNSVTKTVSLEVTVVTVSPLNINFGTVYLDSVTTKNVTVTNLGSVPVNVSTPLISILSQGDSREFVAVNLCLQPLQPHKSCTIQVSYVAGPFYHQQSAMMSVKFNSAGSPQTVSLTGLTIDPEAKLSATSLSFATQKVGTSSASKTITLTNPGATTLTINSVTVSGSDPHDFVLANHCSSSVGSGASCTVGVTFKPGAKGARSAKLVVSDNAKNSPQSVTLTGTGN